MGYSRDGETVTLTMSRDDYMSLLLAGIAVKQGDTELVKYQLGLVNRLNEGNPQFTPYEIPR